MQIYRLAPSGAPTRREIPVTQVELIRWAQGTPANEVWPFLTADEISFIVNGIDTTPKGTTR